MVFYLVQTHVTYKLLITLVEALLQYLVKISWSFLDVQIMELWFCKRLLPKFWVCNVQPSFITAI